MKITVIIAVWNGAKTIQSCLDSVIAQTGVALELIVLDGGSTDGTVEIINKSFLSKIEYFESRPDDGIYDAWNKGIRRSTGEWICFLGADDLFSSPNSLSTLVNQVNQPNVELIASQGQLMDSNGKLSTVIGAPWDWKQLLRYITFCHPGLLHRRSLFERVGFFDTNYKICADHDFMLRAGPHTSALYLEFTSVLIGTGGVSRKRRRETFRENYLIQIKNGYISPQRARWNWALSHVKAYARDVLRRQK